MKEYSTSLALAFSRLGQSDFNGEHNQCGATLTLLQHRLKFCKSSRTRTIFYLPCLRRISTR
jgi:hypothetical protein